MRDLVDFSTSRWVLSDGDEASQELLHVSDQHNAGEERKGSPDLVFDEDWRYVLASGSNDKLFGSARDEQYSIFGYLPVIARMQVSVIIDGLCCFL